MDNPYNKSSTHENRRDVLKKLGRYEEALAAYDIALAIYPKNISTWKEKGDTLKELGRYEEALTAHEIASSCQKEIEQRIAGLRTQMKKSGESGD